MRNVDPLTLISRMLSQGLYPKSKPRALAIAYKKARDESLEKNRVKNKNEVYTSTLPQSAHKNFLAHFF
jgi:hypothetical protein